MSTLTAKAPKIRDCEALNLAHGYVDGDRYYGKVNDRLAVCIYTVGKFENYFAQMFPIPGPSADLHNCYVDFALALAKRNEDVTRGLRRQYRYITKAEDVLTLKCLIHEAEDRWRECNVDDRDAGPEAGEGVE